MPDDAEVDRYIENLEKKNELLMGMNRKLLEFIQGTLNAIEIDLPNVAATEGFKHSRRMVNELAANMDEAMLRAKPSEGSA